MSAQPAPRQDDDTLAEMVQGPGGRLRVARQARGLDIERIAAELHLAPERIAALERDDYAALSGSVFVTGYMRNYARLLGLDPEPLLEAYRAATPEAAALRSDPANADRARLGSGQFPGKLLSIAVFAVVCGLVLAWWRQEFAIPEAPESARMGAADAPEAAQPPTATGGTAPLEDAVDQQTEIAGEAAAGAIFGVTTQEAMSTASTDTPAAAPLGDTPPLDQEPAGEPITGERDSTGAEGDGVIAASAEGETPPGEEAPATTSPPAAHEVVLAFSGPCWVDIRDSDREFKLFGEMSNGDRHVLEGKPPYSVILGNTAAVAITVGGEPYDLTGIARGNVARFTLDPGELP
jgi:cytoskeleton protein RodZ